MDQAADPAADAAVDTAADLADQKGGDAGVHPPAKVEGLFTDFLTCSSRRLRLRPATNRAEMRTNPRMSCRHRASQLASFGRLLELGPLAAQPSVESAGGMEGLPRWTAEGCAPAATSTTRPLCGTSSDW